MAIREGRWDCATCGQVGNLGRDQVCPSCGAPRDKNVRFYLPEDAPVVEDAAQLAQAKAGVDWLCQFCGSSNSAAVTACTQCGAIRGTSPARETQDFALNAVPRSAQAPPVEVSVSPPAKPFPLKKMLIGAAVGLAALIGLVTFLAWPRYRTVTPVAFHWERAIDVEDYRTVSESGWSVPAGGRVTSQRPEIHHFDQVLDHYETRTRQVSEQVQTGTETYVSGQRDLGNGYFEDISSTRPIYETRSRTEMYQEPIYRSVPVMATKYAYDIERWLKNRDARAAGDDQQPRWPDTKLKPKEREGPRRARYMVRFQDDRQKPHERQTSEAEFLQFQKGVPYRALFDAFGSLKKVTPADRLKAEKD